jgi:hypothetical protein
MEGSDGERVCYDVVYDQKSSEVRFDKACDKAHDKEKSRQTPEAPKPSRDSSL